MTAHHNASAAHRVAAVDGQNVSYAIQPKRRIRPFVWVGVVGCGIVLLITIILPNLCKAREPANRIKCANNLRQIVMAANMYAQSDGGAFPRTIHELGGAEDLGASVFDCPSDRKSLEAPANPAGSYIYVADGVTPNVDRPETVVIVYEPLENHSNDGMTVHLEAIANRSGDGMNVGFADAHVEWVAAAEAVGILKQAASGVRPIRYEARTNEP